MHHCSGKLWKEKVKCEHFVLALGNLSAANFEDKNYSESRANAEVLINCCKEYLSADRLAKLTSRKEQCSKFLGVFQSGKLDNDLPACDLDKFSIVYEETLGRNGVAISDINFGDILLIDKPVVMRSKVGKEFCTHCMASLKARNIYKSLLGDEVGFMIIMYRLEYGFLLELFLFLGVPRDCIGNLSCAREQNRF